MRAKLSRLRQAYSERRREALHSQDVSRRVPLPREEVFAFFADAANLQRITPPELDFQDTHAAAESACKTGTLIDYRLSLFGGPAALAGSHRALAAAHRVYRRAVARSLPPLEAYPPLP